MRNKKRTEWGISVLNNGGDKCFLSCLGVKNIASRQFGCYFDITVRGSEGYLKNALSILAGKGTKKFLVEKQCYKHLK